MSICSSYLTLAPALQWLPQLLDVKKLLFKCYLLCLSSIRLYEPSTFEYREPTTYLVLVGKYTVISLKSL